MFRNRTQSSLFKVCESYDCQLVVPPLRYCTDNGVMIAWNGVEKWLKNHLKNEFWGIKSVTIDKKIFIKSPPKKAYLAFVMYLELKFEVNRIGNNSNKACF